MGAIKVDSHQHFWKYNPAKHTWITEELSVLKSDFYPGDLKPHLDENGFDLCVAVQAEQSEEESEFLLNLAGENDFIGAVVGWIDLCALNCAERAQYFASFDKFKGVRHIVQDEPDDNFLLRKDFLNGITAVFEAGLTYDILVFPRQLPAALKFVSIFENEPLVIDHLAKPNIKDGLFDPWAGFMSKISRYENVSCKLSGMVTEASWNSWKEDDFAKYLDLLMEKFGPSRLMIGSDWPVCLLAAEYGKVVEIVRKYISGLSPSEQELIMGVNAIKFYNI